MTHAGAAGRVYITLSQHSSTAIKPALVQERLSGLSVDDDADSRFVLPYQCAWGTLFNQELLKKPDTPVYLGSLTVPPTQLSPMWIDLGRIRCDFLLVQNQFFRASSIHTHFLIENNDLDLEHPDEDRVRQLVDFIAACYTGRPPDWPPLAKQINDVLMPSKSVTQFPSKYTYVSVCGQSAQAVREWRPHAETIYQLLVMQGDGTTPAHAKKFLSKRTWTSASFYRNFHQPGAALSISCPFPEEYVDNPGRFMPTFSDLTNAAPQPSGEDEAQVALTYDLLAEYPPLRYLGLPMLTHAGCIEEVMRSTQERLFRIYDSWFPLNYVKAAFGSLHLQGTFYKLNNLDTLKLPVSREYSEILVKEKNLAPMSSTVQQLQAGLVNGLLIVIAILTIVLGVVALGPQFSGCGRARNAAPITSGGPAASLSPTSRQ